VTIFDAGPETGRSLIRAERLVEAYLRAGYADGSRNTRRQCVLYGETGQYTAAVWGGADHIRIIFSRERSP